MKKKVTFVAKLCVNYKKHKTAVLYHNRFYAGKDARVAEEARLESVYTSKAYPGFESPSLRKFNKEKDQIKNKFN